MFEGYCTALNQILEASRAGHQYVRPSCPLGLGLDSDAAVDGRDREGTAAADRFELVDYL